MEAMILDLLDANRIQAGERLAVERLAVERLAVELAEVNLGDLARATLDELITVHGDWFVLELPREPLKCRCDAGAVRRILENLCSNAVKYGAREQPVTVRIAPSGADHVAISVHNRGNPIPAEELGALFETYRRAHSAPATGQKGWGLGLTLVKGLAEAHGGAVRLESSAEAGTTFTVELPKAPRAP